MEGCSWRRCLIVAALWMGRLCRSRDRNEICAASQGPAYLDEAQQGRIEPIEDNVTADTASPQAGGRGDGQLVDDARFDLIETKTIGAWLPRLAEGDEFEEDAVIVEKTRKAVSRVFDGDDGFGSNAYLQYHGPPPALGLQRFDNMLARPAREQHGGQVGPHVGKARAACHFLYFMYPLQQLATWPTQDG